MDRNVGALDLNSPLQRPKNNNHNVCKSLPKPNVCATVTGQASKSIKDKKPPRENCVWIYKSYSSNGDDLDGLGRFFVTISYDPIRHEPAYEENHTIENVYTITVYNLDYTINRSGRVYSSGKDSFYKKPKKEFCEEAINVQNFLEANSSNKIEVIFNNPPNPNNKEFLNKAAWSVAVSSSEMSNTSSAGLNKKDVLYLVGILEDNFFDRIATDWFYRGSIL